MDGRRGTTRGDHGDNVRIRIIFSESANQIPIPLSAGERDSQVPDLAVPRHWHSESRNGRGLKCPNADRGHISRFAGQDASLRSALAQVQARPGNRLRMARLAKR